eukprot:1191513-Prorocentrum_minimum.AAC.1
MSHLQERSLADCNSYVTQELYLEQRLRLAHLAVDHLDVAAGRGGQLVTESGHVQKELLDGDVVEEQLLRPGLKVTKRERVSGRASGPSRGRGSDGLKVIKREDPTARAPKA